MANNKKYWFKTREHGWAWGMPATWQGWATFALFLLVWVWAISNFMPLDDGETGNLGAFVLIMVIDVAALVMISFKYGDAPSWAGGRKPAKSAKPKSKAKSASKAKTATKTKAKPKSKAKTTKHKTTKK